MKSEQIVQFSGILPFFFPLALLVLGIQTLLRQMLSFLGEKSISNSLILIYKI